jgi:PIN domain nuclease of toxin-antitoxin system
MNPHVLDANAVLALLRGEPGAPVVAGILADTVLPVNTKNAKTNSS